MKGSVKSLGELLPQLLLKVLGRAFLQDLERHGTIKRTPVMIRNSHAQRVRTNVQVLGDRDLPHVGTLVSPSARSQRTGRTSGRFSRSFAIFIRASDRVPEQLIPVRTGLGRVGYVREPCDHHLTFHRINIK